MIANRNLNNYYYLEKGIFGWRTADSETFQTHLADSDTLGNQIWIHRIQIRSTF